jgi:dihydropteroate synthase
MHRCTVNKRVIGRGSTPLVMGVINCSPESFYKDSYVSCDRVHAEASRMVEEGAGIIDIGARSTAPGAPTVSPAVESERMHHALADLDGSGITVSVDTLYREVLAECLSHEIHAINDISGLADPVYADLAAASGLPVFVMASRSVPGDAGSLEETFSHLSLVISRCEQAGIREFVIDPGIGLWTPDRSTALDWELCRHFGEFSLFCRPLLAAVSRKAFLGNLTGKPPELRLPATLALTAILLSQGADVIRTHDVAETQDVIRVYQEMERQR